MISANEDIKFDHMNPVQVFENSKPVGWLCDTPIAQAIVNEDDDDCIKVRKDPSPKKKRVAKAQQKSVCNVIIGEQSFLNPAIHVVNEKNPAWFRCPQVGDLLQDTKKFATLKEYQEERLDKANSIFGSDSHLTVFNFKKDKAPKYVQIKCRHAACPFSYWLNYDNVENGQPIGLSFARSIHQCHDIAAHAGGVETVEQPKAKRTPTTKRSPKLKEQKSQKVVQPVVAAPSPKKQLPPMPQLPIKKVKTAQMIYFQEVIPKLKSMADKKFEMSAAESSRRVVQMWNSLSSKDK